MYLWIGAAIGAVAGHINKKIEGNRARHDAREARQWEDRMSSTAYQRSMKDMKKAGLNPILAYQQGGASSPNAAVADQVDYDGVVSSAINAQQNEEQQKVMLSQREMNSALTAKYKAETKVVGQSYKKGILDLDKKEKFGDSTLGNQFQSLWRMYKSFMFPKVSPEQRKRKIRKNQESMEKRARKAPKVKPSVRRRRNKASQQPSGLDDYGGG